MSVDDDGVPTYDENHPNFHSYNVTNSCSKASAGCTSSLAKQGLIRHPAPGGDGKPIQDEQIGFALPVGYVRHEVHNDGEMVINVTLPGKHLLNPGIVRRWVSEDKANVYIHTYGEGTGRFARANEELKNVVWDRVDNQIFEYMRNPSD